ncbi:effector-associated constant component EACC1 [Nocardia spumae]|uniref:effector-associated constant component EACC1 n=1 Tax=Nocardia spumae TaxID=2887190 RepID=UPI001D143E06|nr:hypothetical protein [Nocardia spumae]
MDDDPILYMRLTVDEVPLLMKWLRADPELSDRLVLKAKVRQSGGVADATVQLLSVALGSGGIGVVLARSLSAWLAQRSSDVKLTISDPNGRRVELDAHRVRDAPQLLDQVARMLDQPERGV